MFSKTRGWTLARFLASVAFRPADSRCSSKKRKTEELLQKLKKSAAFQVQNNEQAQSNEKVLESVWSGYVAQMEGRSVLTRKEPAEAIRKLAR